MACIPPISPGLSVSLDDFGLVPGPVPVVGTRSSVDVQDLESYAPEVVAKAILDLPGCRLLHAADPSWWEWKAEWTEGDNRVLFGMTLFADEAESWGGSFIEGRCAADKLVRLWSEILGTLPGLWLHDTDCAMYSPETFLERFGVER